MQDIFLQLDIRNLSFKINFPKKF